MSRFEEKKLKQKNTKVLEHTENHKKYKTSEQL